MKPVPGGYIVVVGSLNMDLVVRTHRHPAVGETVLGGEFRTFPGGKGANQAVASSRLGVSVKMIGRVGTDDFGLVLLNSLGSDGVDTRFVFRDPEAATGVALITVGDSGQNTIVVASGANSRLDIHDLKVAEEVIRDAAVLVAQLESPLATVSWALALARQAGVTTILNPAPAQPLESSLLENIDYLIPNEHELALLSGRGDLNSGVEILRQRGVKNLVVTLGENGALAIQGEQSYHIPAFKVEVLDTTAAGDAFIGAFAAAITQGLNLEQAVRWGNAAGALAATRAGAQPSLPDLHELLEFSRGGF